MLQQVIVDTGVLVALIDRRDRDPCMGNRAVDPDCAAFADLRGCNFRNLVSAAKGEEWARDTTSAFESSAS